MHSRCIWFRTVQSEEKPAPLSCVPNGGYCTKGKLNLGLEEVTDGTHHCCRGFRHAGLRSVCYWQGDSGCPANVPKETVEALWTSAARGELLTSKGWARATVNFTQPGTPDEHGPIQVVSDYYGVNFYATKGTSATVDMEFTDLGQIDSSLRYTPPTETHAYKTSMRYQLVSGPSYAITFGPEGKTVADTKVGPGITAWAH